MYWHRLFFWIFCLVSLSMAFILKPVLIGDGSEYLNQTISFTNHGSFDFRKNDIETLNKILHQNNINFLKDREKSGYFESNDKKLFSYHFWFYSLLCTPVFIILKFLGLNELRVFALTNSLLLILLFYFIAFRSSLSERQKTWTLLSVFLGSITFYLTWSHPEVFIFTSLSLGLLFALEKKFCKACLFSSIASLQSPPLIIIPISIILFKLLKKELKNAIKLCLCSSIALLPSVFYFYYFGKANIIASNGYASVHEISLSKILSLFFDPNFGLLAYATANLIILFLAICLKRDSGALLGLFSLIFCSVLFSTAVNWNCGMMYIHRYSVVILPLLIFSCLNFIEGLSDKQFKFCIGLFLLSTGITSIYCLREMKYSNSFSLTPAAKLIISTVPSLYNPPHEVLIERSLGPEITSPFPQDLYRLLVKNSYNEIKIKSHTGEVKKVISIRELKADRLIPEYKPEYK